VILVQNDDKDWCSGDSVESLNVIDTDIVVEYHKHEEGNPENVCEDGQLYIGDHVDVFWTMVTVFVHENDYLSSRKTVHINLPDHRKSWILKLMPRNDNTGFGLCSVGEKSQPI